MKVTKDLLEVALALTITSSNELGNEQGPQLSKLSFPIVSFEMQGTEIKISVSSQPTYLRQWLMESLL